MEVLQMAEVTKVICDSCGREQVKDKALDWVYIPKSSSIILLKRDRSVPISGEFCNKECIKRFILIRIDELCSGIPSVNTLDGKPKPVKRVNPNVQ